MSKRQVRRLFADLPGVPIPTGMIAKLQRQAGEVLAGPMAEVVAAVRRAGAVHVDEAGWREAGRKAWLWAGATARATAFGVHRSRGHDGLEALLGDDPGRDQVVISDRFPTHARAPNRQLCRAHTIRTQSTSQSTARCLLGAGPPSVTRPRWLLRGAA